MSEARLIVLAIHRYRPDWRVPPDIGRDWVKTRCAFHADDNASAAVSYVYNAYKCLGCPAKGDAVGLVKQQEGVTHSQAVRILQEITSGGYKPVPRKSAGVSGRRVFTGEGATPHERPSTEVPARIRGRSSPWT